MITLRRSTGTQAMGGPSSAPAPAPQASMVRAPSGRRDRGTQSGPRRGRELPDYYVAPTRDFTQFTRDYEEHYWRRDTAFDWGQSVEANLEAHLQALPDAEFGRIARLALPLVEADLEQHMTAVEDRGLPLDEDALKALASCLPFDRDSINQAHRVCAPLERVELPVAELSDRLAILERGRMELREQRRLRLFRNHAGLKRLETEAERAQQARALARLESEVAGARARLRQCRLEIRVERERLRAVIRTELAALAPQVLADLLATLDLVRRALPGGAALPTGGERERLLNLVLKRQLRALTDIANHALVVEQSAIAPLTTGIVHYRRRREIQEAMTTFVHDEAKHSAVFRRFMAEKMRARERIPEAIIRGGERYLWIARLMPGGAVFLAVVVEAIGGAFLEFFAKNEHMPDPLFRGICRIIAERDEKRHQELCSATYNELYRTGSRWENLRNRIALRELLRAAYGDKTEDHHLIQACRAFGLEADTMYRFVASALSRQLETVGMYVEWESLLEFLPKPVPRP